MDCGIRRRVEARMQIVLSGDWYFPPLKIYISVDDCYERTGAGPVVTGISKELQCPVGKPVMCHPLSQAGQSALGLHTANCSVTAL